jgi:hypothetical protein
LIATAIARFSSESTNSSRDGLATVRGRLRSTNKLKIMIVSLPCDLLENGHEPFGRGSLSPSRTTPRAGRIGIFFQARITKGPEVVVLSRTLPTDMRPVLLWHWVLVDVDNGWKRLSKNDRVSFNNHKLMGLVVLELTWCNAKSCSEASYIIIFVPADCHTKAVLRFPERVESPDGTAEFRIYLGATEIY